MDGATLIAIERERQIRELGHTAERDDRYRFGQLAQAAACFALPGAQLRIVNYLGNGNGEVLLYVWPSDWRAAPHKPANPAEWLRCMVKAGALLAAEIDRLQREAAKAEATTTGVTS